MNWLEAGYGEKVLSEMGLLIAVELPRMVQWAKRKLADNGNAGVRRSALLGASIESPARGAGGAEHPERSEGNVATEGRRDCKCGAKPYSGEPDARFCWWCGEDLTK